MKTSEELQAARDIISDPEYWCQAARRIVRGDHFAYCAFGALEVAHNYRDHSLVAKKILPAMDALAAVAISDVVKYDGHIAVNVKNAVGNPFLRVSGFNDSHTHAEVLAWFDKAIARQKHLEELLALGSFLENGQIWRPYEEVTVPGFPVLG
jgi:hypothetical protein